MKKVAIALGTLVGLAVGCYRYAPDHCGNNQGDASCAEGLFCDGCSAESNGCVEQRPAEGCYLPAGFDGEIDETSSSGLVDPTSAGITGESSATVTIESSSTTSPDPECVSDGECLDPARPFCDPRGACVTCEGTSDPHGVCAGLDAQRPVCSDGACVQCTAELVGACVGMTPVCDAANECVACTEHSQCPQSACHLGGEERGACFDVGDVVMVANAAELTAALSGLELEERAVLVLAPGMYPVRVVVGMETEVAILGLDDTTITGDGSLNAVEVVGNSIAYFQGVTISNLGNDGLSCSTSEAWLDDVTVRNTQIGVQLSSGCVATMRRSAVRSNSVTGMRVEDPNTLLRAENSLIVDNVGPAATAGLRITAAEVDITYSVIVSNGTFANPDNVECLSNVSGAITNSIVLGPVGGSIVTCDGLSWEHNALDVVGLGATNQNVGAYDGAWFVEPGVGDYHLTTAGGMALMDMAMWQDGDPLADIDGDPIPVGGPSLPGVDQP